jgi:hypothetical protein
LIIFQIARIPTAHRSRNCVGRGRLNRRPGAAEARRLDVRPRAHSGEPSADCSVALQRHSVFPPSIIFANARAARELVESADTPYAVRGRAIATDGRIDRAGWSRHSSRQLFRRLVEENIQKKFFGRPVVSRRPTRLRERNMKRVKSSRRLKRFILVVEGRGVLCAGALRQPRDHLPKSPGSLVEYLQSGQERPRRLADFEWNCADTNVRNYPSCRRNAETAMFTVYQRFAFGPAPTLNGHAHADGSLVATMRMPSPSKLPDHARVLIRGSNNRYSSRASSARASKTRLYGRLLGVRCGCGSTHRGGRSCFASPYLRAHSSVREAD